MPLLWASTALRASPILTLIILAIITPLRLQQVFLGVQL